MLGESIPGKILSDDPISVTKFPSMFVDIS